VTIPVFMSGGVLVTYCGKDSQGASICSIPFIYGYVILTGCIHGVGGTFLWLAQASYVNLCADDRTRGVANGIFFALLKSSTILSSGIATFVLGNMDQFTFYVILMIISIVASVMFFFLPSPPAQEEDLIEKGQETAELSLKESLDVFLKSLFEVKYRFIFSVMIFSGVALTFYCTSLGSYVGLTLDSQDVNVINQSTGIVFMVLAMGTIIAGPIVGYLADKHSQMSLLGSSLTVVEIGVAVTIVACLLKSYSLALVCGLIWGLGDTSMNTMTNVVIGSYFKNDVQILACYRFFQSLGSLFMTVLGIFLLTGSPYLLVGMIAGVLIVLHMYYNYKQPQDKKQFADGLLYDEKMMIEMKKLTLV